MKANAMNKTGAALENSARLLDRFLLPTARRSTTCWGRAVVPSVTYREENDE
ncbi:MAG: hypothetical protein M3R38_33340 [Actinomycetota bacterium]|nr:hypothetical protein [Actinomycetota bacterium]